MSLLLDALKKAEKAKDDAKRRAQLEGGVATDASGLQVRTRNELPDISMPLEIHSEDLSGTTMGSSSAVPDAFSTVPRPGTGASGAPIREQATAETVARPRQNQAASDSSPDNQTVNKAAAKNVFEAKFREPNPKLPFYITMAVLGVFSLGTVIYFWYQLRPPPPLVNSDPKPASDQRKVEAPPPPPSSATGSLPPAASPAAAIPGLPAQASAPSATPSASGPMPSIAARGAGITGNAPPRPAGETPRAASPVPVAPQAAPRAANPGASTRQQNAASAPRNPADPSRLNVNRPGPAIDPKVEAGWLAYNRGDIEAARSSYQAMLRDDPSNRDALLGMAAVEIRSNRLEQAGSYYQALIQINPRDTHAQAGMLALRAQLGDPVQAESKVKSLLAADPEAQVLNFTLGNQYAQQGRWPEAQQAYFRAYTAEPDNPDFAYNLAVSLDQVRQPKLALEYYRRALTLAQQRSSNFDPMLARNRVQELAR